VRGLDEAVDPSSVASDPLSTTTVVALATLQTGLSRRELEVLRIVAAGLSDKQIAGRLGISPKTVRNHMSQIFSKLQAGNRVEAVINALKRGVLNL
jgi:DNA-binding NarL/FixJ family response regulator